MKLFLGIKYFEDNRNKKTIEDISNLLISKGFNVVNIIKDIEKYGELNFSSQDLMKKTFEAIDGCDVVLIDLSFKGVGLGIEAGYAYANGIPVVVISKNNGNLSKSLCGISRATFTYENMAELSGFFDEIESIKND